MFFDYDKKDLLRRIKTAKSVTSEIYIDEIFCSIQLYPHNSTCSIRFSCKCTDPNLTGIGGDEKYTLMFKTDVINRKIALGFITERVYYASLTFPNSVFLYYDSVENKPYYFEFPNKDWKIHPCHTCKNNPEADPFMLIYGGPISAHDCADSCLKQRF
jgi:hypothetical protein